MTQFRARIWIRTQAQEQARRTRKQAISPQQSPLKPPQTRLRSRQSKIALVAAATSRNDVAIQFAHERMVEILVETL